MSSSGARAQRVARLGTGRSRLQICPRRGWARHAGPRSAHTMGGVRILREGLFGLGLALALVASSAAAQAPTGEGISTFKAGVHTTGDLPFEFISSSPTPLILFPSYPARDALLAGRRTSQTLMAGVGGRDPGACGHDRSRGNRRRGNGPSSIAVRQHERALFAVGSGEAQADSRSPGASAREKARCIARRRTYGTVVKAGQARVKSKPGRATAAWASKQLTLRTAPGWPSALDDSQRASARRAV